MQRRNLTVCNEYAWFEMKNACWVLTGLGVKDTASGVMHFLWPKRVSNPGPLGSESYALPLRHTGSALGLGL